MSGELKHVETLAEILVRDFSERGASHGDLKKAFCDETRASGSTFARALSAARENRSIRQEGEGKQGRYFAAVARP